MATGRITPATILLLGVSLFALWYLVMAQGEGGFTPIRIERLPRLRIGIT